MDKLVSVKKPHRRICPRCHSHNTRLCYIVNSSQRYTCKHCRRCWTHGWGLRNIPIGGRGLKTKCPKLDQPSVSQVSSLENHFGSLPVVLALPARSAPPMDRMEMSDRSYNYQGFHDVGSSGANQEDPNKKFNDTMDKNHNASTSGSSEYPGTGHVIKKNNNNNNV